MKSRVKLTLLRITRSRIGVERFVRRAVGESRIAVLEIAKDNQIATRRDNSYHDI